MPRALASATVSFGLVSIPVKLFSTSESSGQLSFNMLHEACGSRLKQQYICPKCEVVVPRDDMVKGYEFSKGQYVTLKPEEIKALEAVSTHAIEIEEFVPVDKIDTVYFDKSYYLGPDKGGEKPYRLLAEAMRATGRSALARYAARGKQYLVLVSPYRDGLLLQQLRYADEVKDFNEVETGDAQIKDAELKLAKQIIEQIATDEFQPEQYDDEVKVKVHELIQKKIEEGVEITAEPAEAPQAQVIDLMEALKQSLAHKSGDGARGEGKTKKPAKTASRARKTRTRKTKAAK